MMTNSSNNSNNNSSSKVIKVRFDEIALMRIYILGGDSHIRQ